MSQNLGYLPPLSHNVTLRRPPPPPLTCHVIYGCPLIKRGRFWSLVERNSPLRSLYIFLDCKVNIWKFRLELFPCYHLSLSPSLAIRLRQRLSQAFVLVHAHLPVLRTQERSEWGKEEVSEWGSPWFVLAIFYSKIYWIG